MPVLQTPKKGTSTVSSAITTPTTPEVTQFPRSANAPVVRTPWSTIAKSDVAPPDTSKSALKARPSHIRSSMVSRLQGVSINDPLIHPGAAKPDVFNPSLGPLPTTGNRWGGSAVETEMTADTFSQPVETVECINTRRTVRDFKKGEVIALPFHVANMNPNITINHPRMRLTCEGPVFSKRRMVVVLWANQLDMFCLPLYSFEGKGLAAKKDYQKADFVCLANKETVASFKNQGKYPPVVFESYHRKPMTDETTVHLTGGLMVDPRENIAFAGRLTEKSHAHLMRLWQDRVNIGKSKPWELNKRWSSC